MTTHQLLGLDTALLVGTTLAFAGASAMTLAIRPGRGRAVSSGALSCLVAGFALTAARIAVVRILVDRGWWFAADKVLLALPLAIVTAVPAAVIAAPYLVRASRRRTSRWVDRRESAAAAAACAAIGAGAGLLVTMVVGYPVTLLDAMVMLSLVGGLSALTWLGLTHSGGRALRVALVLVLVVPVLAVAAVTFLRAVQPAVIGDAGSGHTHHGATVGGSTGVGAGTAGSAVSVADLRTAEDAPGPVKAFTLTARQETVTLPSGAVVDAWSFGSLPGPEIRVTQGDLVQVTLVNQDVGAGVTLHWHGYRVPNGEDGVAGVTQDAVAAGGSFTYRFVASEPGTYWYHTHQVTSEAVQRGLFGALIVESAAVESTSNPPSVDLVLPVHTFDGILVVGGTDGVLRQQVPAGRPVRLRFINTDAAPHRFSLAGTSFTVAAVDGTELTGPTSLTGPVLRIPAGGRYDVVFEMPTGAVSIGVQGAPSTGVLLSPVPPADESVTFVDGSDLDLLAYGRATPVAGMTGVPVDREAVLVLDRQFRFLAGVPTLAQTINGAVHPLVPPITVREGELLRLTVVNRSAETHPMHPHGHRVLVESRDGVPVSGSPLWLDTFDVQPGEVWQVLLRADNPGIWMAHCHNLEHATMGMVVHLAYEGVSSGFSLGGGAADNRPE